MATKRKLRSEEIRGKKIKKSARMIYLLLIGGSVFALLVFFFIILFNAFFPAVDSSAPKRNEKVMATIWFSDKQERFLLPEKRYVYKEADPARQAKEIALALVEGSQTGLINTFPAKAGLVDVKVDRDGTAEVNFDKNLTKFHPGGSAAEMATIYSLTNSITENVPAVKRVKILVEGKELSSIKGHISTKNPFLPDRELQLTNREQKS
jgi:Sporulation and spore germination